MNSTSHHASVKLSEKATFTPNHLKDHILIHGKGELFINHTTNFLICVRRIQKS